MQFTYKGTKYLVHHWPVTMRYAERAKEIVAQINGIIEAEGEGAQLGAWHSILLRFPDLATYLTAEGSYNPITIMERVTASERSHPTGDDVPPFDRDAAIEEAKRWCQQRVTEVVTENPDLAKLLHFTTGSYPTTLNALRAGVDIIKRTLDRDKTHVMAVDLIDQPIDGDFWQDVDAAEVADYVNTFRLAFK